MRKMKMWTFKDRCYYKQIFKDQNGEPLRVYADLYSDGNYRGLCIDFRYNFDAIPEDIARQCDNLKIKYSMIERYQKELDRSYKVIFIDGNNFIWR